MKSSPLWRIAAPPPDGFRLDLGGSAPWLGSRLLYNRGIRTNAAARHFLSPSSQVFSNPFDLPDMDRATDILLRAIHAGEPVGVFGDFDVDGLTGTAIVVHTIRRLGGKALPYIPHREQDGHGLSARSIEAFAQAGVKLVVTVDTGTTASDEIELARRAGMEVVVTDHHLPEGAAPLAAAMVNPHVGDGEHNHFSGSGVAFKLAQAVCLKAGLDIASSSGHAGARSRHPEPHLPHPEPVEGWPGVILALAALGTVADSAPLTGENRLIVRLGLEELGRTRHPGLMALMDHSRARGSYGRPDTELISFHIAPRLNAPGRLGDAEPSLRLLITENLEEAETLACRLDELNTERRRLSDLAWRSAMQQLDQAAADDAVVAVRCDGLPMGLLGPLAGRLCDVYNRPAIAYASIEGDGLVRASVRSVQSFDIHGALVQHAETLVRFGGHARASGFTVRADRLDLLLADIRQQAAWSVMGLGSGPALEIDADVPVDQLSASLWDFTRAMEPFGEGNPQPLIAALGVTPTNVRALGAGGRHLRMTIEGDERRYDAIGFGLGAAELGRGRVDIAFSLRMDDWNGRARRELELKAIRPSQA